MKYYSFFIFCNLVFWSLNYFIRYSYTTLIGFIIIDVVYILCIYVWNNQKERCNKIIYNCEKASNKPVIHSYNKRYHQTNQISNHFNKQIIVNKI